MKLCLIFTMGKTSRRPKWAGLGGIIDTRDPKHIIANLCLINRLTGQYSPLVGVRWVGSRPLAVFVRPFRLGVSDYHLWYFYLISNGCTGPRPGQTLVQYLGDSDEVQYCAWAVGLPLRAVLGVENWMLIMV